ncbi:hypothetical protein AB0I34_42070 [Kribbella sp. NPDC050281]|uniref:hypothetical protein n=1 Tax=Kribbella sp. NPDC050281 TaxID=3155515 RepID=UPI0033E14C62
MLSNLVLHTGRDLDQLTTEDFLELRAALTPEGRKPPPGISVAWDLARGIARIPDQPIRHALLPGQLRTDELIDAYGLQCRSVRDVLVRYLNERRPVLDYSSFSALARTLGSFWADIEAHHPGIDSLQLSDQATEQWRQRVSVVIGRDGTRRPRLAKLNIFVPVRAFYLDIAQWALTDPSWASTPSDVLFAAATPAATPRTSSRSRRGCTSASESACLTCSLSPTAPTTIATIKPRYSPPRPPPRRAPSSNTVGRSTEASPSAPKPGRSDAAPLRPCWSM